MGHFFFCANWLWRRFFARQVAAKGSKCLLEASVTPAGVNLKLEVPHCIRPGKVKASARDIPSTIMSKTGRLCSFSSIQLCHLCQKRAVNQLWRRRNLKAGVEVHDINEGIVAGRQLGFSPMIP